MKEEDIDKQNIPKHIAVIMDGNGRWAKKQGFKTRIKGHENGVQALRNLATAAAELGVKYLTVYAFSTENWNRPKMEVNALMNHSHRKVACLKPLDRHKWLDNHNMFPNSRL